MLKIIVAHELRLVGLVVKYRFGGHLTRRIKEGGGVGCRKIMDCN